MTDLGDVSSKEDMYFPARVGGPSTGISCLAFAAFLALVGLGNSVPVSIFESLGTALLNPHGSRIRNPLVLSAGDEKLVLLFSLALFAVGALSLLRSLWRLPRLVATKDGLTLKTFFTTSWARWSSLSPFDVRKVGGSKRHAIAGVIGPAASPSVLSRRTFIIPDVFGRAVDLLAADLNARRAQALGAESVVRASRD